ncbi:uncharacterized protein LOC130808912 isoform X2 [Amaranthus tricolor]|uniref:uncharacterized protein LOC130808912 isoform X2 n=1 Tax=Amaranthus tricolor TaxID=29722 RepID=UPI00258C67D2|nr:uncharacterized protein LOC130808912 isoform X2 [Amaranthus tricolor]XP_057530450.1 uncharacterized protein LOC130808912 isoform X2 [Amaranthus tricolor]
MGAKTTGFVWMTVMAVAMMIMVAENGRMCKALDMSEAKDSIVNTAEEARKGAESWSTWAYNKVTGTPSEKISITPSDMKQGAEDMMHKASEDATDAKKYVSAKLHTVSHSTRHDTRRFYDEAKRDAGEELFKSYATQKSKEIN